MKKLLALTALLFGMPASANTIQEQYECYPEAGYYSTLEKLKARPLLNVQVTGKSWNTVYIWINPGDMLYMFAHLESAGLYCLMVDGKETRFYNETIKIVNDAINQGK